jgi:hypothetical protein
MKKMLNEDGEEVIYIEYHDGIPHSVLTAPIGKHGLSCFDFEYVYGDKKDIRFYESGGGGRRNEIDAPHYIDGCTSTQYWMAADCKFKGRSKAKNCTRVDKPLRIRAFNKSSINPFKVADETSYGFEYCSVCEIQTCDGEGCREHQEWSDEEGCLVYIHDGSRVE